DNARARDESEGNSDDAWFRENQLDRETRTDGKDERYDERLNVTEPFILKVKHSEHVEGSDDTSPNQRNAKEKLQADRRTDHFGQIACCDCDFAKNPQSPHRRSRVMVAAGLREITSGSNTEFDAEMLEQDRHEIRNHDDHQQSVTNPGAPGEIGGPIAWVHVADRDQKAGTGKCEQLSPKRSGHRNHDAAMDFTQRNISDFSAPDPLACGQFRHWLSVPKICSRASGKRRPLEAAACSFVNEIIYAPAFFRISRLPQNRTGRVDQDSSDNNANVCTSKATAPASRARLAQMNSSMPARLHAGLHSAQGQSANEKQPGNVLAATARNGQE